MRVSCPIALAVCLISSQAQAHWEYTRWGMSPKAVAASSRGAVQVGPGAQADQILAMPVGAVGVYRNHGHSFHAVFYFQKDRLALIELTLLGDPSRCSEVLRDLVARYGKAEDDDPDSDTTLREWSHDRDKVVFLRSVNGPCTTNFSPVSHSNRQSK